MSSKTKDRYLFLMRHAEHREGHLTERGSAQVRALAARMEEWVRADWRTHQDRRIRLWYTTSEAPEVLETIDLLTRDLSAATQIRTGSPNTHLADHAQAPAQVGRERWMAAPLPVTATTDGDPAGLGPAPSPVQMSLSAYSPDSDAFRTLCEWLISTETGDSEARSEALDAPLLVGNDPLIGWLTSKLTRGATPVARGELVCLIDQSRERRRTLARLLAQLTCGDLRWRLLNLRWRLLWTISEDGANEAEAIRAKIRSKMSTAAALGTVIVGLTVFLLQSSLQKQPSVFQWLAFAALGSSAVLYFASLFLYDGLQMPVRFWGSTFPSGAGRLGEVGARFRHGKSLVRRPPSSSARLLQASMVRIWTWIFTPATFLAGIGVALLAYSVTRPARSSAVELRSWHVAAAIGSIIVLSWVWIRWHRPNLGASD